MTPPRVNPRPYQVQCTVETIDGVLRDVVIVYVEEPSPREACNAVRYMIESTDALHVIGTGQAVASL